MTKHDLLSSSAREALWIAVIYAAVSALWVLFSDQAVLSITDDPTRISRLQTYKGWTFAMVSAGLIFYLIFHRLGQVERLRNEANDSQQRFRDFAEASSEWFWEMDEDLRFSYFSEHEDEILPLQPEILLGKTLEEYFAVDSGDEDLAARSELIAQAKKHLDFHDMTYSLTGADGLVHIVLTSGKAIFDADGQFRGYRGVGRDVTERHRIANDLSRQRTLFAAIFNDSPDPMALDDPERSIFMCNPAFLRVFGYNFEELKGKKAKLLYADQDDFGRQGTARFNVDAPEVLDHYVVNYRRKNGEIFPGDTIGAPVRDLKGGLLGYLKIIRDVSEERRQQTTLQQSQKLKAVGQLTSGITHDFNNILTVLKCNLDLLALDENRPAREQKLLLDSLDAVAMGASLSERLLSFSGTATTDPTILDLNELIPRVRDMLQRTLGSEIDIECVLSGKPLDILVNPTDIESALVNLIVNAKDAMPDGGTITLGACSVELDDAFIGPHQKADAGAYARVYVSDTGTGMPPEVAERALEPFYTTKDTGKGTGLGLSSVYGLAQQAGGFVLIDSIPGEGTTVTIYLPLLDGPAPRTAEPGEAARFGANLTGGPATVHTDDTR